MIRPGTLCLLLDPHEHAPRTCTVVSFHPLLRYREEWVDGSDPEIKTGPVYVIDVPGERPPPPARFIGALREHLIPIAPPPSEDLTRQAEYDRLTDAIECGVRA